MTRPETAMLDPLALPLAPLTAEGFAAYGEVIRHAGTERRRFVETGFGAEVAGTAVTSWVSRIERVLAPGALVTEFERHPHSDQLFVPLSGQRFLVMVCDDAGGRPDAATARAFLAGPGEGVLFRRNVWHAGMQVFDAPAEFFVQMRKGHADDEVFVGIERPIVLAGKLEELA